MDVLVTDAEKIRTLDVIDIWGRPKSAVGQIMIYKNKARMESNAQFNTGHERRERGRGRENG